MREVPRYDRFCYRGKSSSYCVLIPVLNEAGKIEKQLQAMQEIAERFDVIIADGGSSDGSLTDDFLSSVNVRAKLVKTGPGKLSAQMRMALDYAMEEAYLGFIFMDGNNKDNPEAIARFASKLSEGYDHVQGSRFIEGGKHENTPLSRHIAIRALHAPLISLAARFKYTDTTNGFRAYSRKFISDSRVQPFREIFSKYELHYYLAIRAARLGFRVIEIPVERIYPASGKVPTKITGLRGYGLVMKTLLQACLGVFNPKKKEENHV
ncbi:MAG TPA: glycosyltransferase family 2 protein [Pseudobdellovibrionaceae bacterium]|jgi:glycosyltransferase involved in cell wall biosynthesis